MSRTDKPPKRALGRGLGALIPQKEKQEQPQAGVAEIALSQISPNPYQPRKNFRDEAIKELTESVRVHGIVQPLLVTRLSEGKYQLIAGERRFRAAKAAGLEKVPAVVKESVEKQAALEIALIENIQREDLNPIEEAVAFQQLHEEFSLTQEEIAKQVGKDRSTVANLLRLLRLPDKVKTMVASGQISIGHARAILALGSAKEQEALAQRVVRDDLTVRQTEALGSPKPPPIKPVSDKDVFTRDAEEKLQRSLRTKVEIRRKSRGGSIQVHFSNEDELIRLFDALSGGKSR